MHQGPRTRFVSHPGETLLSDHGSQSTDLFMVADDILRIVRSNNINSMPLVPPLRTQFPGKPVPFRQVLQRHALAILVSGIGHGELRHDCTAEH